MWSTTLCRCRKAPSPVPLFRSFRGKSAFVVQVGGRKIELLGTLKQDGECTRNVFPCEKNIEYSFFFYMVPWFRGKSVLHNRALLICFNIFIRVPGLSFGDFLTLEVEELSCEKIVRENFRKDEAREEDRRRTD